MSPIDRRDRPYRRCGCPVEYRLRTTSAIAGAAGRLGDARMPRRYRVRVAMRHESVCSPVDPDMSATIVIVNDVIALMSVAVSELSNLSRMRSMP